MIVHCSPCSIRSGSAGSSRRCSTRTSSWAPTASARISKFHEHHPYVFYVQGQEYRVDYLPAESNTGMFGGNSNWRGPVWMPVNAMIIRALLNFYLYYGDNFKIECPTGSGKMMNLFEVSKEISDRLTRIFRATSMAGVPCTAAQRSSRPIPTGGTTSSSTNTSMATMARASAQAIRPDGPGLVAKFIQLYGILDAKRLWKAARWRVSRRKEENTYMKVSRYPSFYQINTRVWLTGQSRTLGRARCEMTSRMARGADMSRRQKITLALLLGISSMMLSGCDDLVPHDTASLLRPGVSKVRDRGLSGRLWDDVRRRAGPGLDVETADPARE